MPRHFWPLLVLGALGAGQALHIQQQATPRPSLPPIAKPYTPTDPLYPQQWNLAAINMPGAWQLERGAPVTVAVLDTGYLANSELAGRETPGYDFVSDADRSGDGDGRDANPADTGTTFYHGSLVAQLIGAAHDGRGIAGVNPQARIVAVRVADTQGTIAVPDLVDAIRWSAGIGVPGVPVNPRPAKVLNLSLFADFIPLTGCDPAVQAALDDVNRLGVTVVVGAANDGADAAGYTPAGCRNVITVTATDDQNVRPAYANWGRAVTLAAPGGTPRHGILTSVPQSPGTRNGTSLSTPLVTGVVSLMLGLNPKLTPTQIKRILQQSASPFPNGVCDPDPQKTCGAGILNAGRALDLVKAGLPKK